MSTTLHSDFFKFMEMPVQDLTETVKEVAEIGKRRVSGRNKNRW